MLEATSRRLIVMFAAAAITMSGAGGALAADANQGGIRQHGGTLPAGNGDINPMCMLRPQDCMYPPKDRDGNGNGNGNGQAGPADGINPLCMLRPQDCMYPPGQGRDGDRRRERDPDDGGMNPLCMFRPQDCWPPPGYDRPGN
jgi:hypothetical protein